MSVPENPSLSEKEPSFEGSYKVLESPLLTQTLELVDQQKQAIEKLQPVDTALWATIQEKLKIHWTYDSNAIEGSKLTLGETMFFLQHGMTAEGKPFQDYLDANNHSEAIELLYEMVSNQRAVSVSVIKEFNALLLSGVSNTKSIDQFGNPIKKKANPGEYKTLPNHVLQPDGKIHYYVEPLQVAQQMDELVAWIQKNEDQQHPVILAAIAHYNMVRIHPFDDGNGRGARLLMNLLLIKKGFPPAIIRNEERRKYLETITQADRGHLSPFIVFIAQSLFRTQEMILADLGKAK